MLNIDNRRVMRSGVAATDRLIAAGRAGQRAIAGGPDRTARPAISVIVPVRNRVDLIADTIHAVFAQDTMDPYEVIVVDNASGDGTAALLRDIAPGSPMPFRFVLLDRDRGPAFARNVGALLAAADVVAFTDSDCVPAPGWLSALLRSLEGETGVVQGRTAPLPGQPRPLFNHFIETDREDGSYSTSNVAYRREAVLEAGGFDPSCRYWEDVDLGWRVRRAGWTSVFAADALVHHQVIPQSPIAWLRHALKFYNWPAKTSRYPEFRRHLFLGVWVEPFHALFQAFVLGVTLAPRRRLFLLLCFPYVIAFIKRRKLGGRWPLLKVVAHVARDAVSFAALAAGSVRFRSPVL